MKSILFTLRRFVAAFIQTWFACKARPARRQSAPRAYRSQLAPAWLTPLLSELEQIASPEELALLLAPLFPPFRDCDTVEFRDKTQTLAITLAVFVDHALFLRFRAVDGTTRFPTRGHFLRYLSEQGLGSSGRLARLQRAGRLLLQLEAAHVPIPNSIESVVALGRVGEKEALRIWHQLVAEHPDRAPTSREVEEAVWRARATRSVKPPRPRTRLTLWGRLVQALPRPFGKMPARQSVRRKAITLN